MKLLLKTKRLVIRPLELKDYSAWKKAFSTMGPPQNRWDKKNRPLEELTLAKFTKILREQKSLRAKDYFYDFAVLNKEGEMLGTVSLMNVVRGLSQTAFLGYGILNPYWGRGYGKEAVRAAIDWGFRELKLHRIEAGVEPYNRRSILLARKLQMRKEGTKKRAVYLRETWVDLVIYSLTCEEWGIPWRGKPLNRLR